ncbi:Probable xyloglucan galactosyltransferase GT17 [Linum perenne]
MIFHARLENHPCRTVDPTTADLFYVPFYGGLHQSSMAREMNLTARDHLAVQLARHLSWLTRRQGRDHFLVLGRTAWDFMRTDDDGNDYGANVLLRLTALSNVTVLTVERQPWEGGKRQVGIPYPSYFHPFNVDQVRTWQTEVKGSRRPYLWSFIGAPRKGGGIAAVREELMRQCSESRRCKLVNCTMSEENEHRFKCHDPKEVLNVMRKSQFCLQVIITELPLPLIIHNSIKKSKLGVGNPARSNWF